MDGNSICNDFSNKKPSNETVLRHTLTHDSIMNVHPSNIYPTIVENGESIEDRKKKREIANHNERKRMQSINKGFEKLRELLPNDTNREKLSKASILQKGVNLIKHLIATNNELQRRLSKFDPSTLMNDNFCPSILNATSSPLTSSSLSSSKSSSTITPPPQSLPPPPPPQPPSSSSSSQLEGELLSFSNSTNDDEMRVQSNSSVKVNNQECGRKESYDSTYLTTGWQTTSTMTTSSIVTLFEKILPNHQPNDNRQLTPITCVSSPPTEISTEHKFSRHELRQLLQESNASFPSIICSTTASPTNCNAMSRYLETSSQSSSSLSSICHIQNSLKNTRFNYLKRSIEEEKFHSKNFYNQCSTDCYSTNACMPIMTSRSISNSENLSSIKLPETMLNSDRINETNDLLRLIEEARMNSRNNHIENNNTNVENNRKETFIKRLVHFPDQQNESKHVSNKMSTDLSPIDLLTLIINSNEYTLLKHNHNHNNNNNHHHHRQHNDHQNHNDQPLKRFRSDNYNDHPENEITLPIQSKSDTGIRYNYYKNSDNNLSYDMMNNEELSRMRPLTIDPYQSETSLKDVTLCEQLIKNKLQSEPKYNHENKTNAKINVSYEQMIQQMKSGPIQQQVLPSQPHSRHTLQPSHTHQQQQSIQQQRLMETSVDNERLKKYSKQKLNSIPKDVMENLLMNANILVTSKGKIQLCEISPNNSSPIEFVRHMKDDRKEKEMLNERSELKPPLHEILQYLLDRK
ncbi:hypothetical protein SNEBB_001359 [Seison nebaliae]|nr:hypothetical protein SNEBB_001359 [Seison nebaliae]